MVSAIVHPQFLLSLSDQVKRICDGVEPYSVPIGVILGKFDSKLGTNSLFLGIELTASDKNGVNDLRSKLLLLDEIYGNGYLNVVGIFSVFNTINKTSNKNEVLELVSDLQQLVEVCNNGESIHVLQGFNADLFTICEYTDTSNGFILKIYDSHGIECDWCVKSTNSEETMLTTLRTGNNMNEDKTGVNEFKTSLKSMDVHLSIIMKFIQGVKSGEVDISNEKTRSELDKIMQLVNKILIVKELESNNDEGDELTQITSIMSIAANSLNENIIATNKLQELLASSLTTSDSLKIGDEFL